MPSIGLVEENIKRKGTRYVHINHSVRDDSIVIAENNRICFTTHFSNNLNVLDFKCKFLYTLRSPDFSFYPKGIAVNAHMMYYVGSADSIVAILADGNNSKNLRTFSEMLERIDILIMTE